MELTLSAAVLERELGLLQGVVERRTTHQILGNVLLEVRESNAHAQGLYDSLGFRPVGKRPGYYSDTGENALIMVKELSPPDERVPGEN